LQALRRSLAGPRNSAGTPLYLPFPPVFDVAGWRNSMFGTSTTAVPNAARATNTSVKYVFMTPPQPDFDYLKFDFDKDVSLLAGSAAWTAATATDYARFRARGAKLLVYTGVGDALLNPNGVRRWYQDLVAANGGEAETGRFARFFAVPGMGHCLGGPALDQFDPFGAVVRWVEDGKAPDALVSTGAAFPGRSRPVCAFPKQARYTGSGSTEEAANFRCE
jgi:hypothetical protein